MWEPGFDLVNQLIKAVPIIDVLEFTRLSKQATNTPYDTCRITFKYKGLSYTISTWEAWNNFQHDNNIIL